MQREYKTCDVFFLSGPCVRKLFTGLIMYLPSQNKEHCIVLYCIVLSISYAKFLLANKVVNLIASNSALRITDTICSCLL